MKPKSISIASKILVAEDNFNLSSCKHLCIPIVLRQPFS